MTPVAAVAAGDSPKKKVGALAFSIAAVLVVAIGATAGLLFRAPWPRLVSAVPKDVEVYVELPSIKSSLAALKRIAVVDASKVDDKKLADNVVDALATAFALPKDDAKDLAMSLDSAAVAVRAIATDPEVAILFSFASRAPVEKLLTSPRFSPDGTVGRAGKTLLLKRDGATPPLAAGPLASVRTRPGQTLAWFEKKRLLVHGPAALVADIAAVVDGDRESLEKSALYREAKGGLSSGAAVVVLADTSALKRLGSAMPPAFVEGFFKSGAPISMTMTPVEAGILSSVRARLDGDKLPDEALYASPPTLKLAKRLPSQTLAYVAFSTKFGGSPKALVDAVQRNALGAGGAVGEVQRKLGALEETLGVSLSEALGALGEQGVVALVAPEALTFAAFTGLGRMAVVWIQHVKEKAIAQKLLTRLQAVSHDGQGMMIDDYLLWATGERDAALRAVQAFQDGKDVLAEDGAHARAIRALPSDPQLLVWVDTGRVLGVASRALPGEGAAMMKESGFSVDAIRASGADRATSAMAFAMKPAGGGWNLAIDTLNVEGVGAALAIYGVRRYIASAKSAEARNTLGAIRKDLSVYVENLPEGAPRRFPPSAPQVPASVSAIRGKKYLASPREWESPSWKAIRFSMDNPQYYAYEFETSEDGQSVTIRAHGDLNGDGVLSLFELTAKISDGVATWSPSIAETNPDE